MSKKKQQRQRRQRRRDRNVGLTITPEGLSMWLTRCYPAEVPSGAIETLEVCVDLWLDHLAEVEPAQAQGIKELKEWRANNSASPEEAAELLHQWKLNEAGKRGLKVVA